MKWDQVGQVGHCISTPLTLHRGSYMSAPVLLHLLNKLGKSDKIRGFPAIYPFFATSLINSIIQEHEF